MRDGVWNRPNDGEAPAGSYDGWGPGTDPRTGRPLPRSHAKHWVAGTVFADGSKPAPCWCQEPPKQAAAPKDTAPRRRRAPETVIQAHSEPEAVVDSTVPDIDDAAARRLLLVYLRRLLR